VTASGDPHDLCPALDERGAPIVGPNLIPQQFTTDPGRAVITGDPADFEAFDTPQLRGIAQTAPYFHDNSRETLREVVDEYSRFLLPFLKPLELPTFPPEQPGGRKEGLSPEQKNDLLEFLEQL
jgi:cytochrome c peroxidase